MRQKLSKELRRLANEVSHDHSFTEFPRRKWNAKSVVGIYRGMKKEVMRMSKVKRKDVKEILKRIEVVE